MRKILALLLAVISLNTLAQTPTYKYLSGSNPTLFEHENALFQLTEPGPRKGALTFTDSLGNLWLHGGEGQDINTVSGFYNDFWRYEPQLQTWTWYEGKMTVDRPIPKVNNSLEFNGINDKVIINNELLDYTGNFTIELWFKTTSPDFTPLISLSPKVPTDKLNGWALRYDFNNVAMLQGNGEFLFESVRSPDIFLKDGEWHHVAFVLQEPNGLFSQSTQKLYVDGELVSELQNNFGEVNPSRDHVIVIGAEQFVGSVANFKGQIDEVRIWDKARTSGEIRSFHDIELSGEEENLVAYYNFNQGVAGSTDNRETTLINSVDNTTDGQLNISYRPGTFRGQMTNVRIWQTDRGDNQIRESFLNELDDLDNSELVLAYDFNQGIPGGNNLDQSIITDQSGKNNNGTLQFFDLQGGESNFLEDFLPIGSKDYYNNYTGSDIIKLDIDQDNDIDILSAAGDGISIYFNDGDGSFETITNLELFDNTRSLVSGDWNGDDIPDLAAIAYGYDQNPPTVIRVFTGDGDGNFSAFYDLNPGDGSRPYEIETADFNSDGNADLVVTILASNIIRIYLGNGNGDFNDIIEIPTDILDENTSAAPYVADYNLDGFPDIGVVSRQGSSLLYTAYINDGIGGFDEVITTTLEGFPLNLSLLDFNQDGIDDIIYENRIFAEDRSVIITHPGIGDGSFGAPVSSDLDTYIEDIADVGIDDEGNTEVIIINRFQENIGHSYLYAKVLLGGELEIDRKISTQHSPNRSIGGDFNEDGINDIVVANWGVIRVFLREQNSFDRKTTNNVISFDGNDDRVEIPDQDFFESSFTFEAWIKTTDNGPIFSYGPSDPAYNWNSTQGGFALAIQDNKLKVFIEGNNDLTSQSEIDIIDGNWHNVAMRVGNYGGLEYIVLFFDGEGVMFEDIEFDQVLASGDPNYTARIGYVSDNFGDTLGARSQLATSNWQE
ncbi:MAG: LamG-like jellyroll fold domain-containing protein, partial [Cyclobacteriaceae bacterium]